MKRTIKEIIIKEQEPIAILDCAHAVDLSFTAPSNDLQKGDKVNCLFCAEMIFPTTVFCYKTSPEFTQDSIPKGFLKSHSTKAGVWAKIIINNGQLLYILDNSKEETQLLNIDTDGIIVPEMLHHVAASGNVNFHVEFYRSGE